MSEKAYDVVIMGAGIVGVACVDAFADRGLRVVVVVEWDLAREEFADRRRSSFSSGTPIRFGRRSFRHALKAWLSPAQQSIPVVTGELQ